MQTFRYLGISVLFLGIMHSQNDESLFVNEVYFLGNKTISERQLKKNINLKSTFLFTKTKFDRRILKLDAITIKNRYKTEGFLNATVRDSFLIQNNTVDIYFIVNEGQRIYINNIDIEGNKHISRKKIQKSLALKKNIPFNPVSLNTNLAAVEEKWLLAADHRFLVDLYLRDGVGAGAVCF